MNEKERKKLNELYQELDTNNQTLTEYLSYIEKLDKETQKYIYSEIRSFLLDKKSELLRHKHYQDNEEYQKDIKKINYWLYQINSRENSLYHKINKIDIKKEKKKKDFKIKQPSNKPKIKLSSEIEEDGLNDNLKKSQQEILKHMELELDILSNNIQDIIEAYKTFMRNTSFKTKWDYIIKLSNFILHKLEQLPNRETEIYRHMIMDCLKYKKLSIDKDDIDEKSKIKELQDIWKQDFNINNKIQIDIFSADHKEQVKNIMRQAKTNKEDAYIEWLESIEEVITKCSQEELEILIVNLLKAKETCTDEVFQERLTIFLNQYTYIFENYFDSYIMNMNIPKSKQKILNDLKLLINDKEITRTNNDTYQLFYNIIFKEKNLSSLKKLLSMDPKFVNIRNYNGTYLLENILDLLINQIINDKYYFLENVFLIFLKYVGIYMTPELRNNLIRKIKDTIEAYEEQYNLDCILSNLHNKLENVILLEDIKVGKEEVYTHEKNKESYKKFNNLLNRTIITIDQKDTKYYENAISCDVLKGGNYQIGIYVSDVVDCLNQDLIIDSSDLHHKEYKTATNRYTKHILKEGKVKFAIAFTFITDEELNIIDFQIERARIRVKKNYTIEEATEVLDEGDSEDKQFYILQRMNNVARIMYRKRNPKNYLKKYMEFIPEIQREFTFFLNRYIAKDAATNDLPLIFKNQLPKESSNLLENLENECSPSERIEKFIQIISSDKMSSYSTINRGNDYFNGEEYTQVTSPTRELASLLNQILIINNYIDKEYINKEQKDDLTKTLMLINRINSEKK